MVIRLKSAHEAASSEDGARVLVERHPPRGMSKQALELRAWLTSLAPSEELGRWFQERPGQWLRFRRRYLEELCAEEAASALTWLHSMAEQESSLTLLIWDPEPERSHGAILRDLLEGGRKPPSSSGPTRMESGGRVRAQRRKP